MPMVGQISDRESVGSIFRRGYMHVNRSKLAERDSRVLLN